MHGDRQSGNKRHSPAQPSQAHACGMSDQQAIYNRLNLIDCRIVARCVTAQASHGSYLDPNLANSHCLLTAPNLQAPNAEDEAS